MALIAVKHVPIGLAVFLKPIGIDSPRAISRWVWLRCCGHRMAVQLIRSADVWGAQPPDQEVLWPPADPVSEGCPADRPRGCSALRSPRIPTLCPQTGVMSVKKGAFFVIQVRTVIQPLQPTVVAGLLARSKRAFTTRVLVMDAAGFRRSRPTHVLAGGALKSWTEEGPDDHQQPWIAPCR